MQYYQRKPPEYCAVLFNGIGSLEDVSEFLGERAYTMTNNGIGELVLTFSASSPDDTALTVENGDFIVRNPDGSLHVMGRFEFRSQFQVSK